MKGGPTDPPNAEWAEDYDDPETGFNEGGAY